MKNKKRVLLIAGGGSIGSYTAKELAKMGRMVDVICLEDCMDHDGIHFIKENATREFLENLLSENHYDAIVDFLHYVDMDAYQARFDFLMNHTGHLVFLSSYRVYADEEHPIRESSPQLLDVSKDQVLLENDTYAIAKCRGERLIRASNHQHWTIVRPLISFSSRCLTLLTLKSPCLISRSRQKKKLLVPREGQNVVAGLDWAGNVGKMIAHLVLNEKAYGESFTLGTGEVNLWGTIAQHYSELLGAEFVWVDQETYLAYGTSNTIGDRWGLETDRLLDRTIDPSKMLEVTGLKPEDFLSVRQALELEIGILKESAEFQKAPDTTSYADIHEKMDAYLAAHGLA